MASVRIFYGSETDTALDLAETLGESLEEQSLAHQVIDMQDQSAETLADGGLVVVITSTFGDGEPPYNARDFYEGLHQDSMPRLDGVKFAVLALGDRSYPHFCQCGKDFDSRFEALGAERILALQECDGDPSPTFEVWQPLVIEALRKHLA